MKRARVIAWAVLVVGGGILIALPFRKPPAPPVASESRPPDENMERQVPSVTLQVATRPIAAPHGPQADTTPIPAALTATTETSPVPVADSQPKSQQLAVTVPLPSFARESAASVDKADAAIPLASPLGLEAYPEPDPPERPTPPVRPEPVTQPVRRHRIVDGDTLQRIAQRYLDDPQRWPEIYRINRDLVPDPDLLPIGKQLAIPPRNAAAPTASSAASSLPAVSNADSPATVPATPPSPSGALVPIPPDFRRALQP